MLDTITKTTPAMFCDPETGEWIIEPSPAPSAEERAAWNAARDRDDAELQAWNARMEELDAKIAAMPRMKPNLDLPTTQSASTVYRSPAKISDRTPFGSRSCPRCGKSFTPSRKNQRFCGRGCQKNGARGHRPQETSRQAVRRRELAAWMFTAYFATAKTERLGLLKEWLDLARSGDRFTADVLRNPLAFKHRQADVLARPATYGAQVAMPHAAEWFCQRFLGCHVWEWVSGEAPEPETGETTSTTQSASTVYRSPAKSTDEGPVQGQPEDAREVHLEREPNDFLAALRAFRHHVVSTVPVPPNLKREARERYSREGIERPRTLRGLTSGEAAYQRADERAMYALDCAEDLGITTGLAGPRMF